MLDILKWFALYCYCFSSCFWICKVEASQASGWPDSTDICVKQAHFLEDCVDPEEMIYLVVQIREYLTSQGYQFPRLTAVLEACRAYLIRDGFCIDEEEFDTLYEEFKTHEKNDGFSVQQVRHHRDKSHKKKKNKDLKISSKTAMGFIKFVGGTLLCLIPVPVIQGAGASLAIVGVSEMVDGAREQSDKKEWDERVEANKQVDRGLEKN